MATSHEIADELGEPLELVASAMEHAARAGCSLEALAALPLEDAAREVAGCIQHLNIETDPPTFDNGHRPGF